MMGVLLNCRWPFVLAEPLHADLTIGIDIKNNTAGFSFVFKAGQRTVGVRSYIIDVALNQFLGTQHENANEIK